MCPFFTDNESRHHLPVVVIGEDVQKAFFANMDPVGKWIEVNGHQFEVIGAMQRPANSFPGSEDLRILFPYFTNAEAVPQRQGKHADRDRRDRKDGAGGRRSTRRAAQ
ncbi:MAG: hypothetical protein DMG57_26395 [Acidobacteria bacterium]|nr:MAG: hypothetical protein DMG57_26395 [Acidobacteriota bacterium]